MSRLEVHGAAERWLEALPQSSIRLGLERIEAACAALGRPQSRYPAILVAGTNGKGSTCAYLAHALKEAGLRVGLYTSPHLVSCRERIRVDGVPISMAALDAAMERLQGAWAPAREPGHPDAPTYFEAMTALAFTHFAEVGVEAAVIEVGLGGRLDATNVPGTDLRATVVTRIARDHVGWLGESLEGIAAEKGAIARPGVPLVIGPQEPAAMEALLQVAASRGAPVVMVGGAGRWSIEGIRIPLPGAHQKENAAVALATLQACAADFGVDEAAARRGIEGAWWPGRFEVIAARPEVILDGAHNPDGAAALARTIAEQRPGVRPHLVFGVLADKERQAMMRAILPLAAAVHLCVPESDRALEPERLEGEARELAREVSVHRSVESALQAAQAGAGPGGTVLVCGSLHLVGAARRVLCGDEPAV